MRWLGVFTAVTVLISCHADAAFAMATRHRDPGKTGSFIISGIVSDQATRKPVSGAEISVSLGSAMQKAVTGPDGKYQLLFNISIWPRFGTAVANALEYNKISSHLIVLPGSGKRTINFALRDVTKPALQIISPADQAEIFTDTTVELHYADGGSGINVRSVNLFAGKLSLTKFITSADGAKAICVVPEGTLCSGRYVLLACVKDMAGNQAQSSISITIIGKVDHFISLGKKALIDGDSHAAFEYFTQALGAGPKNKEANLYAGLMRVAMLFKSQEVFSVLKDMGFTGPGGNALSMEHLDPFHLQVIPPAGISKFNLPALSPGGKQIQDVIENKIVPELDGAVKNLNVVLSDKNFISKIGLSAPFVGYEEISIGYADTAIIKSMFLFVKAFMHELLVRDIDIDPAHIKTFFSTQPATLWSLFELYPELLRVKSLPHSLKAREALTGSIDSFIAGFAYMLYTEEWDKVSLLSVSRNPGLRSDAMLFVDQLRDINKSIKGTPDRMFSLKISQLFKAGDIFTRPFDIRRALEPDSIDYILNETVLPYIDYASQNLSKARITYREFIPAQNSIYNGIKKEIDYADIKAALSGLNLARSGLLSVLAYDTRIAMQTFAPGAPNDKRIHLQNLLDNSAHLLRLSRPTCILQARDAFSSSIKNYLRSADYLLRREDGDQSDDMLVATEFFRDNSGRYEAMLRDMDLMKNTLIDPVTERSDDEFRLNLAEFFVRYKDVRDYIPRFDVNNHIVPATFPDEHFGGIVPED